MEISSENIQEIADITSIAVPDGDESTVVRFHYVIM